MSPKERARMTISGWLSEDANDGLNDLFSRELDEWGFPTDKIEWSLGYSQGDGVAFYGDVDVQAYFRKRTEMDMPVSEFGALLAEDADVSVTIERNSYGYHYSHYNTMDVFVHVDGEWNQPEDELSLAQRFEDVIAADVRAVSKQLERMGYAELEVSEESIIEHCDANEYRFLVDGSFAPEGDNDSSGSVARDAQDEWDREQS